MLCLGVLVKFFRGSPCNVTRSPCKLRRSPCKLGGLLKISVFLLQTACHTDLSTREAFYMASVLMASEFIIII